MRASETFEALEVPISAYALIHAASQANSYLSALPGALGLGGAGFYATLNQRNLSGFVGEVLKHAIFNHDRRFVPNPHPDGRPDLLDLRRDIVREYFKSQCFDSATGGAIRDVLAPFRHGGVEIKCTIGNLSDAGAKVVGDPRVEGVTGITYWAHHAHECNLLGIYYDYSPIENGSPQIKALFYTRLLATDWNKVSIGDPTKKKTSNTSLNRSGKEKLYRSLALYTEELRYVLLFKRLRLLL